MSKFCSSCGTQLSDDAAFCPTCGNKQALAPVSAPVTPTPASPYQAPFNQASPSPTTYAQPSPYAPYAPAAPAKKLTKNGVIGIIAISALVIIIVVVAIAIISSILGGYKTPINNMVQGVEKSDWNKYSSAFYGDELKDYESYFKVAGCSNGNEFMQKYIYKTFEAKYGENIKISVKYNKATKLTNDERSKEADTLKSKYGHDVKIDEAYYVDCTFSIKGNSSGDSDDSRVTVGKIGGKWYVLEGGLS